MRRLATGCLVLTGSLVLSACGGQEEHAEPVSVSSSSASPVMPDLDQFTPPPPGYLDVDTQETASPVKVPSWDSGSRTDVVESAENAMRAFARPGMDRDTWWAELEPLLTQQAAQDYAYVEPSVIPAKKVNGPGELVDDTSAYVGFVEVPTDAGIYTIILNRSDADAPWLVSRFNPPEESN